MKTKLTIEEVEATILGLTPEFIEQLTREPGWLSTLGLPLVDLNDFGPEADFEVDGMHKRVRAGLSALSGRTSTYVHWETSKVESGSHYSDYDRKVVVWLQSTGSQWGSTRRVTACMTHAYHVTGGGAKDDATLYAPIRGMIGVVSNAEGGDLVAFRLVVPNEKYVDFNSELRNLWTRLTVWLEERLLEDCLSNLD